MIAARDDVVISIENGSASTAISHMCSGHSGCSVHASGHCDMHEGEEHHARNCVGGLLLCTKGNLHGLNLGAHIEEFSIQ